MSELLIIVAMGIIAIGAVAFPVLAGRTRYVDAGALERDVARYREALRAGTVCRRCRRANPPESAFCAECGRELTAGAE